MSHLEDFIADGYSVKIIKYQSYLYDNCKATTVKEVADFIDSSDIDGEFKFILFSGFTHSFAKLLLLIDVCKKLNIDFPEDHKELTKENYNIYF